MAAVNANTFTTQGAVWSNERGFMRLTYDFAADGGATTSTYRLAAITGKMLITEAVVQVETACTSGGSAVVTIGAETADPDGFLDATSGAVANLIDDFTVVETAGQSLVVDTGDYITLEIATAALTAGKINVFVSFYNAV